MTVQPTSTRRPRRSFRLSELRIAQQLYADNLPIEAIARRLDRDRATLYQMMRHHLDIPRKRPGQCGTRQDCKRRNAKIIDAILARDGYDTILRRWEITPRALYGIMMEYKILTGMTNKAWRKNFGHIVSKIFTPRP